MNSIHKFYFIFPLKKKKSFQATTLAPFSLECLSRLCSKCLLRGSAFSNLSFIVFSFSEWSLFNCKLKKLQLQLKKSTF
ncbi:unnamed protein product [Oikopleura dioica]|uniref:Uncharacterized protein n=1 Tax=Oikopleura dioica TaxID=34765 RepID=E4XH52_OIKDI|nr:unnamed protein product [Oikopleura dioica]